ncbi:MAG: hypothetical protein OEY94_02625 [Alphaproteobacteria bacterium]|nr:hypothetical protein [Alphaproteobacteria bacterium]
MKGQPFFFDENYFDDDSPLKLREDDQALELKYTDDDLEIAKNTAYAKGKKDGLAESKESIENQCLKMIERTLNQIATLMQAEDERNKRYEAETTHLTMHILKKVFPVFFDKAGLEELQALIKKTLETCPTANEITLTVHSDIRPQIEGYLHKTDSLQKKNIKIVSSDDMNTIESRLSWPDGGAILAPQKVAGQILDLLTETLAAENITVDNADEENSETLTPQNVEESGEKNE